MVDFIGSLKALAGVKPAIELASSGWTKVRSVIRRDNDQIALFQAATELYEVTEGTLVAKFASGSGKTTEKTITWLCMYLLPKCTLYGATMPSTRR